MSLVEEVGAGLDGLAQLRALICSGRKPGILRALDFEFVEVESGKAVFAGTPGEHAYNPLGTVHGGYAATLLDSACGCAVHSRLSASQAYTTLDLNVSYHRPITRDTGALRAEGRVRSLGKRVGFAEGSLTDAEGRLYASATSTLLVFDFDLPTKGWANRVSGRTMGEHMEETAKELGISREEQDRRTLLSHQSAIRGQDSGFFRDLIIPFAGIDHDTFPRRDTSLEKLAKLPAVFDRASGSITAGNSSPLTDGAASIWVGDTEGLARLGAKPAVKLVDWEVDAVDFRVDGMLMAPARAIPRLLARHRLRAEEIALWEIHEAFAAQLIANLKAAADPVYRHEKAGVDFDIGSFPVDRINPNGGSIALGHPFGSTGARILSQAVKELTAMSVGARGVVSVCADGGQGTVALLQHV